MRSKALWLARKRLRPDARTISAKLSESSGSFSRSFSWFRRVKTAVADILTGDDHINPKKLLERRYIYLALLASRYRQARIDFPDDSDDNHHDIAVSQLEAEDVVGMSNVILRKALQDTLHPQVIDIFQTFAKVDHILAIDLEDKSDDQDDGKALSNRLDDLDWERYVKILQKEYKKTFRDKEKTLLQPGTKQERELAFLKRKQGALECLLNFHGAATFASTCSSDSDAFGLELGANLSHNGLTQIRQYQSLNMCRSALIREELGFSVVSFRSLVPGAGRGAFVDGNAPAGSILAFQPGDVWPKEHLLTSAPDVIEHFAGEDDCHVSLRFDDYVVDSRQSPVTVLTREGSMNPWAIGHMANHPPSKTQPNVQSTMLNFTERMNMAENDLFRYLPNTYARLPSWRSRVFEAEEVVMHGLCLLSKRDVSNEELVYDYRLQSETTPDWYSVVRHDDTLDDEQVVFFREDWKENK